MDSRQNLIAALTADADVQLAVIFGSEARDSSHRQSDLDIGVSGVARDRLAALAVTLARLAGREVDLISLDTAPPLLRFEIARDGSVLLARAPHLWPEFQARAMVEWWEWAPLARRFAAAAMVRLDADHGQA
ncbi:MAG: nucleotidyltransferase domain-containing protein [Vicinamibacterales bacterium]